MAELSCGCLNVIIHLDSKEIILGTPVKPSDLLISIKKASVFEMLCEVKLGVAGITVVHNSLMQSYQSGDWMIHKCANCNVDTHVTHCVKGDSKVFVTDKIETDVARIEKLRESEKFSTVFNVILNEVPKDEVESFERQRVFSMSFGNKDPVMKQIHQQMKTFLNKEEIALEARITNYEKEQREAFARLRNTAHKERGLLFRSLAKVRATALSEAAAEEDNYQQQQGESSVAKSRPMIATDRRNRSPSSSNNSSNSSSPGRQPRVTIMLQDKPIIDKTQVVTSKESKMDDALFGMDGMDEEEHGAHFIQSDDDDDESTSTDDSYREEVTHSSHPINVAHSLPISVPLFRTYNIQPQQLTERRDEKVHITPGQMAESIKALALSVHQETEVFGDLPKPRTKSFAWAR